MINCCKCANDACLCDAFRIRLIRANLCFDLASVPRRGRKSLVDPRSCAHVLWIQEVVPLWRRSPHDSDWRTPQWSYCGCGLPQEAWIVLCCCRGRGRVGADRLPPIRCHHGSETGVGWEVWWETLIPLPGALHNWVAWMAKVTDTFILGILLRFPIVDWILDLGI